MMEKDGLSQTTVAAHFGVKQPTVSAYCKRHGIKTLDPRATSVKQQREAIQAAAERRIAEEVASGVADALEAVGEEAYERALVDANAAEVSRVMKLHREGSTRVRRSIQGLLSELEAQAIPREKLNQLIEMVATWQAQQAAENDFDLDEEQHREAAISTFTKLLGLENRADTAKKLVDSFVKIVDLERRVYGIKDEVGETDAVKALRELMNS